MQKPFLVLLALLTAVIMVGCTPSSPSATPSALPEVSGGDAENTVTPDPVLTPEPGFSPVAGTSLFDFSALSVSFFDLSAYGFAAPEYSVTDNTLVLNISGEASYGVINMQLSAGDSIKNAMSRASDSGYMRIRIENTGESDANIAVLLVTADGKSGCLNPAGAQLITLTGKKRSGIYRRFRRCRCRKPHRGNSPLHSCGLQRLCILSPYRSGAVVGGDGYGRRACPCNRVQP